MRIFQHATMFDDTRGEFFWAKPLFLDIKMGMGIDLRICPEKPRFGMSFWVDHPVREGTGTGNEYVNWRIRKLKWKNVGISEASNRHSPLGTSGKQHAGPFLAVLKAGAPDLEVFFPWNLFAIPAVFALEISYETPGVHRIFPMNQSNFQEFLALTFVIPYHRCCQPPRYKGG